MSGFVCPATIKNGPTPIPVYTGKSGGPQISSDYPYNNVNDFAPIVGQGLKPGTAAEKFIVKYPNGYTEIYLRGTGEDDKPITKVYTEAAWDKNCLQPNQSFIIKT